MDKGVCGFRAAVSIRELLSAGSPGTGLDAGFGAGADTGADAGCLQSGQTERVG